MPTVSRRLARTAFAGLVAWAALLFVPLAAGPGPAELAAHLVLLAPLGLVPLYLDACLPASFADAPRPLRVASWMVLPGALGAAASFLVPAGATAGALAALWLAAAVAVAVWAIGEAVARWRAGAFGAAEAVLTVGWAALPGGAAWLVAARAGVDTGYGGLVDLLTAAHVHYAGALAAVWAGLLGRTLGPRLGRLHAGLAAGLVVGFWGVAVGIALGRGPVGGSLVETVGVAVLAVSGVGLGVLAVARAGGFESRFTGGLIALSGGSLALALGLAAWFHGGARLGLSAPDYGWMAERHGSLVAFGFGLWGAIGWRRLRPRPRGKR